MTESSQDEALNVLLLAGDFYPKESGGAFIDWNVAKHLVESGDSVTVVTPRNADIKSVETVEGVEIRRPFRGHSFDVHPNSKRGILRRVLFVAFVIPYLLKLCWRQDFDLLYSTNHQLHFPAAIVSAVFGLPHISFVGYSPSIRPDSSLRNPLVILERLNFRFFMGNRVLCRTPSIYDLLSEKYGREVVRLDGIVDREAIASVDTSAIDIEPIGSDTETQLIFVGRLVEVKNPTELPYLVSRLPQDYSLRIVGDGPRWDATEAAIKDAGVDGQVSLEGQLSHEETLQLIYSSDLLLLPSEVESYGAVVFEALTLNTPVIATPVGVFSTIDHPRLITAELGEFIDIIPKIQLESVEGVDQEILDQFVVDRFAEDVRNQMEMVM